MTQTKKTKRNLIALLVGAVLIAGMLVGWHFVTDSVNGCWYIALDSLQDLRFMRLAAYMAVLLSGVVLIEVLYGFFASAAMAKMGDEEQDAKYRFLFGTRVPLAMLVALAYAALAHAIVAVLFGNFNVELMIPGIATYLLAVFGYLLIIGNTVHSFSKPWVRVLIDALIIGGGITLSHFISLNRAVVVMVAVKVVVMLLDVFLNYKKKNLVSFPIAFIIENAIYCVIPCVVIFARTFLPAVNVSTAVVDHLLSALINVVLAVAISIVLVFADPKFRKELSVVLKNK